MGLGLSQIRGGPEKKPTLYNTFKFHQQNFIGKEILGKPFFQSHFAEFVRKKSLVSQRLDFKITTNEGP